MKTDFRIKGFHIDLRIQVMPMASLRRFVGDLAKFGLNTLLVEWEATYPYEKHAIISNEYAYKRQEVESFIAYCAGLGIDVIPLQQCFGHIEYILRHERYAHLRESNKDICQLCPLKKDEAYSVFRELLSDIAASHPSKYIHIGGDETYLLGHCQNCRSKAERDGKSRLYVDYFKEIARYVVKLGRRPVLWADMLLKHPEAVEEMPKECIFVDWNYGWKPNYFGDISEIERKGFELWGAAALRSHPDNHSLTCWERHFDNIKDFIPFARSRGYTGMFLTSWSTSGLYGFEWDQGNEVVEMYPVRRVYPLAGFRILEAAYAESLRHEEPIVPEEFVKRYASQRFGLSSTDGAKLWRAMVLDATPIQQKVDIEALHAKALKVKSLFAALIPRGHANEFEHLRLMADLRESRARFKKLENEVQSPQFSRDRIPSITRALKRLIKESQLLDQRFVRVNKGFLYEKTLIEDTASRTKKLHKLYNCLTGAGRKPSKAQAPTSSANRRSRWVHSPAAPAKEPPEVRFPLVAAE